MTPIELLDATAVSALAGVTRDDILKMHMARGLKPTVDHRPDLPLPEVSQSPDQTLRWERTQAEQWAAEWLRIGAESQAEIDAAEQAARDAHADRERLLAELVPAETYGVPVYSLATLPASGERPDHFLLVRQEPLRYDHGRLLTPRYVIEGYIAGSMVSQERLLRRGSDVLPRSLDIVNMLGKSAIELGTPQIRRWKVLYDQADPTLWRETASDLQALMANQMTRLFGDLRRESTAKHLGLDGRAKDGGLNNLDKKLGRARQLDETRDLDRLTRARQLAAMLGIDLDVDLRQQPPAEEEEDSMTVQTMADKGSDYVARWPQGIATQVGISVQYIATAMRRAGLVDQDTEDRLRSALLKTAPLPEIAALTTDDAKRVIAELRAIKAEIRARQLTHCSGCGLPLGRDGECQECV